MASLGARQAYLDGELRGDGITSFSMIQLASDAGIAAGLMFFLFDLLYLDGVDVSAQPLQERKARLADLLANVNSLLQYSDHQAGHGRAFFEKACALSVEGIVSKRADAPYTPGNRGLWRKVNACTTRNSWWSAGPRSANHRAPEITSTSAFIVVAQVLRRLGKCLDRPCIAAKSELRINHGQLSSCTSCFTM